MLPENDGRNAAVLERAQVVHRRDAADSQHREVARLGNILEQRQVADVELPSP